MHAGEQETLRELERTATLAELARPLVHECNNFLNTLLLQIALIEAESPEEHRGNLGHLRRDGRALATLLQEWQRFRKPSKKPAKSDLNRQVQEALDDLQLEWSEPTLPVTLALSSEAIKLPLSAIELKRLCYLLFYHAFLTWSEGRKADATLEISTHETQQAKTLAVRERGTSSDWLKAFQEDRARSGKLLPSACRALAQRLQGKLIVEPSPEGAGAVMVQWPADFA